MQTTQKGVIGTNEYLGSEVWGLSAVVWPLSFISHPVSCHGRFF